MEESLWTSAGSAIPGETHLCLPLLRLLQPRFCRRTPPAGGHGKISFASIPLVADKAGNTKGLLQEQLRVEAL